MRIRTSRRAGYTLIELLVSMALIMTIMAILSQAFVTGLETFGKLRGTAEMSQRLRTGTTVLRRDLNADHFDARIRPSDPGFGSSVLPREGFIRIHQGGAMLSDGTADGLPSIIATGHVLHVAVKLRGNKPEDFFVAGVPSNAALMNNSTFFNQPADARYQTADNRYYSQWAEVCYYLQAIPNATTNPAGGAQQLYGLYRAQRLCVADNRALSGQVATGTAGYEQMSVKDDGTGKYRFNTPSDLTTLANRAMDPTAPAAANVDTLLLSNVISFTVRPIVSTLNVNTGGWSVPAVTDGSYDSTSPPANTRLYGVEISIRVYDQKSQQSRQITLIQDL